MARQDAAARKVLSMLAVLAVTVAAGVLVPASPAAARTDLEVTTPSDGRFVPGSATPLIVTIQADRAVEGTLIATVDGFRTGSQRVEVPGGSSKEVVLIANLPQWAGSGTLTFETGNDEDDATAQIPMIGAGGDELVGVLGSLATGDLPATAGLAPLVGDARFYAFDPALLDAGSEVLTSFTQLLASAEDLEELDEARLAAVERWVGASGGVLVVDEEPGAPLALATGSEDDDAVEVPYGLGRVRYTSGDARAGQYEGLIRPTPSRSPEEFPWGGWGSVPSTVQLARDAGVRVPALGSILVMLAVYTLLAGPLLWMVLRRGRREPLLWVAAPALALVATLGIYGFGRSLRDDTNSAHATLLADLPTLRQVSTQVLVTSANGSSEGVHLGDGWRPMQISSDDMFIEGPLGRAGGTAQATPVLRGGDLVTDLPPGGIGVVGAESTQPLSDPSWQFDLVAEGSTLSGTVTNLSGHDLQEVYVTSGQGFTEIHSGVAAGESAEVTLNRVTTPPIRGDRFMDQMFRQDPWSANDSAMNAGILTQWLGQRPFLRAPGFVIAVGWTRDESAPLLTTRGTEVDAGRTAFLSVDRIATAGGSTAPPIEFLRGWGSSRVDDAVPPGACADTPFTLRLAAPEDATEPVLAVATRTVAALDIWDGEAWVPTGMANAAEIAQEGEVSFSLSPASLADGSLYIRAQMACEMWEIAEPFPELRPVPEDDDVVVPPGVAIEEGFTAVDDLAALAGDVVIVEDPAPEDE